MFFSVSLALSRFVSNLLSVVASSAFTTIFRVTYGLNLNLGENDGYISLFQTAAARVVAEGVPGACPIDLFPLREFQNTARRSAAHKSYS